MRRVKLQNWRVKWPYFNSALNCIKQRVIWYFMRSTSAPHSPIGLFWTSCCFLPVYLFILSCAVFVKFWSKVARGVQQCRSTTVPKMKKCSTVPKIDDFWQLNNKIIFGTVVLWYCCAPLRGAFNSAEVQECRR